MSSVVWVPLNIPAPYILTVTSTADLRRAYNHNSHHHDWHRARMAAADYYNPAGGSPDAPHHLSPHQPQAHPSQQHLNPPYPMSDAPPPYTERPVSQPPPQQRPPLPGEPYRPPPPSQNPAEKGSRPIPMTQTSSSQNIFQASDFRPQQAPPPQQLRPGYPPPHQGFLAPQPAMHSVYGKNTNNNNSSSSPDKRRPSSSHPTKPQGILKNSDPNAPYHRPSFSRSQSRSYSSSRSRSRSRDRDGRRRHHHSGGSSSHHHHHSSRPELQHKKSSGLKTFLGAGGGALIGDAIFPGLGTLGGAILGGIGGHEYGKKQRSSTGSTGQQHHPPHRARSFTNGDDYHYDERRGRRY